MKIADFGVSGQLVNTHDNKQTWVGTAKYMSPERYLGSAYNTSTDVWSLGMVILECITGQYPFQEGRPEGNPINFFDLMDAIITQEYTYSSLEGFSPELISFLRQCLDKDIK